MSSNKGAIAAIKLLDEFGISDIQSTDIRDLIYAREIILREKPLFNSDGRIVFGSNTAIITVNSEIKYGGRKRFTLAHELGHFELHHNTNTHLNDNAASLEYYKSGNQETEANEFATELLMPSKAFISYVKGKKFTPMLLNSIADYFNTSLTSAAFRYIEIGYHPICIFHSYNNRVLYWKKSKEYYLKIKDLTKLSTPLNSVAREYYEDGTRYKIDDIQEIGKDIWFETNEYDHNDTFCEYCIITPQYNTAISIIWEP